MELKFINMEQKSIDGRLETVSQLTTFPIEDSLGLVNFFAHMCKFEHSAHELSNYGKQECRAPPIHEIYGRYEKNVSRKILRYRKVSEEFVKYSSKKAHNL